MKNLIEQLHETTNYIQQQTNSFAPQFGIVLGTGLGGLVQDIDIAYTLSYTDIPHFPVSTVESHSGKLIFGMLGGKPVVAMQGRFHYYEGYTMQQITFPIRVMKQLGIERLIVSNAAGGTSEKTRCGTVMIINDHINLHPANPLIGKNYDELGPRFPDLSQPYDPEMIAIALKIAQKHHIPHETGVYASVTGPNLETRAEYTYMNRIGADAVGMSTIPEVLVGVHSGLKIFAASVITDEGYPPERIKETSLEDVIRIAQATEPHLTQIIRELIAAL